MNKLITLALIIFLFLLCSCANSNNAMHSSNSNSDTDIVQDSTVFVQPSSDTIKNSISVTNEKSRVLTTDEMIKISLDLYENGYLLFMRFARDMEDTKISPVYLEIDGKQYHRVANYNSRNELETALSNSFTDEFIKRIIDDYFNSDNWYHVFEHDDKLFYNEVGGMGGTFLLYTEDIEITNATNNTWDFILYSIDSHTNEKGTQQYTFSVKYKDGQYLIDSYKNIFLNE